MRNGLIIYSDIDRRWYQDDRLHRRDGPAIEYHGDKFWHLDGEFHRRDGPAIETIDGNKLWYVNNKRHRRDGPAAEWWDGSLEWWYDNIEETFEENRAREQTRIANCLKNIRVWLPIESSGSSRFPFIDLIVFMI
jgi:hypothetical protein